MPAQNLTVGSHAFGPNPITGEYGGALNGFLPFSSDNPWNTNIAGAPLDPNNAAIQAAWAAKSNPSLTRVFGTGAGQDGIDFTVIDSTNIPKVRINPIAYGTATDNVVAPYPPDDTIKLEGEITDCDGWPHTHEVDQHTIVLDKATCWLYETGETDRCNGHYSPDGMAIWDMTNYSPRVWSWTGASADGSAVLPGLLKYEEAASGVINHALNFTYSPELKGGSNGYYILPATHTDGTSTSSLMVMGMRVRLKATTDISSFSPINQTILTALKNYGMILAETGSNFFMVGDTDTRWSDVDLDNLFAFGPGGSGYIHAADFEVVQMNPAYPGADATIGPADFPVALPVISSFTVEGGSPNLTVSAGTPVTFDYTVSGANWDENFLTTSNAPRAYIDNIGPLRLTPPCPCSGSVTIKPTVTQEYTLYAVNTTGKTASSQVIVTVPGTVVAPPVFTPPPGSYASSSALKVTLSTTSEASTAAGVTNATFYYTTASGLGSSGATLPATPTTSSTVYSGTGTSGTSISVSKSGGWESLCAIATVPAYGGASAPSTPTCATYYFGSTSTVVDTPVFVPPGGTYNTPPTVDLLESTSNASMFITTDGSTPVPAANGGAAPSGTPPTPPTLAYEYGTNSNCWDCITTGPVLVSNGETVKAIAVTYSGSAIRYTSAMATATYSVITSNPTYSPAGGSYIGTQTVTLSDASPSSTIYFTTDASTPTTGSAVYSSPLTISATTTVRAMAASPGAANSAVANGIYTILIPAAMITPTTGSTLGSSQAFTWSAGNGVSHYELWVGNTAVGSSNLYNSGSVTVTTETVNSLPSNGQPLYVRLYSLINGSWQSADYAYTASGAPIAASMSTPTPGSTLASTSQAFTWNPGNVATHFELWVGTTGVGSSNLYNSGNVTVTTETASGLPSNDSPVYVRLYSLINGAWQSADYTYTSSGTAVPASMSTPTPGSTLGSTSQAFTWTPGNNATHFELWVGSTGVGSSNVYNSGNVTVTTETVNGLPSNGQPLYVRLYSLINGGWQSADYTYTASGAPIAASMSSPTGGSTLGGASQAFTWNPGNTATHFELWVGSTGVGSSNVYNSGNVTVTTETVNGLPSNGQPLYVRLYSLINGAWQSADYTYTASGAPIAASMTSPTPGSQFLSTSQAFVWSPGNTATHFELWLGSTGVGSSNLYNSGNVTATTETVNGLPTNGETIYVRLYSLINGVWHSVDYTYLAQ